MPCDIWSTIEDLSIYPSRVDTISYPKGSSLVIGDLHGNVIKFIYILICHGVMALDQGADDYNTLLSICRISSDDLTAHDMACFFEILCAAEYENSLSLIVLGDDLADRVYNDLLMLMVYGVLLDRCICYKIILSNHSEVALRSIRAGHEIQELELTGFNGDGTSYFISFQMSLNHLWRLIARQVVSLRAVQHLLDRVYKPFVCVVGYQQVEADRLILYTHAPVGLLQVRQVMVAWDVPYDESTIEAMTDAIDALNIKYRAVIQPNVPSVGPLHESATEGMKAIAPLLWQRELPHDFTLTPLHGRFDISLLHGHVGEVPDWKGTNARTDFQRLYSFDTDLGKSPDLFQGKLLVAITNHPRALAPATLTQPIGYSGTFFSDLSTRRKKILDMKFKQLVELDLQMMDSADKHESASLLMDAFSGVFSHLGHCLGASLPRLILDALPVLLTIETLACLLLDPESRLSQVLYGEDGVADPVLMTYRHAIEYHAGIVLKDQLPAP